MKKVLLIEEDINLDNAISLLLTLNNFQVVKAENFREAVNKIETVDPDIIISETSGHSYQAIDLLRHVKDDEIFNDIPCLFLTSIDDEAESAALLAEGASGIIMKPFKTQKLLESIIACIGKSLPEETVILVCDGRLNGHREFIKGLRKNNIMPIFEEKQQDLYEHLTLHEFSGVIYGFGGDDETGVRLIEWIRSNEDLGNLPVLALGCDSGDCPPEKVLEAGADDFFPYPYIVSELVMEATVKVNRFEAYKKRQLYSGKEAQGFEEYVLVEEEAKQMSPKKKRQKHILIIEDDIPLSENLEMHLKLNSFSVIKAERGIRGIEMASLRMPDLILCDIMLPDIDGFIVLEELNKKVSTSSIPFIFLSAKSEISDIRRGMILGANSYVTKPFNASKLLQLIAAQLEKTRYNKILKHKSELMPDAPPQKTIEALIEESKWPSAFDGAKAASNGKNLKDLFKQHADARTFAESNEVGSTEAQSAGREEAPQQMQPQVEEPILDNKSIFLGQRDYSQDFQKIPHDDITVLLINLERAVVRESTSFSKFLNGIISKKAKKIIVDFSVTAFVDSIFVGILVAAKKKVEAEACSIKLVVSDEKIFSNPIIASNLSRTFEIYNDIPSALSSYKK